MIDHGLVSVIIPTYGRPTFLKEAIDSVLGQTYSNYEILIVDDNPILSCERKKTEELLKKYESYPNIIYIKNSVNSGGSITRNNGIEMANGDFITFLDDDDLFYKEKIEVQLNCLIENKVDFVLCNMDVVNSKGNKLKASLNYRCENIFQFLWNGFVLTPMIFITRKAAISVNGFTDTPRFQDHLFILKLLKANHSYCGVSKCLAVHRQHNEKRITLSDKDKCGYYIRNEKEKECFDLLNENQIKKIKLKHMMIQSKIHTDKHGLSRGIIPFTKGLKYLNSYQSLYLVLRTLVRNLLYKNRHF